MMKESPSSRNEYVPIYCLSTDATHLYLAIRMKENSTIDDLCDDMVDITDLPINLTNI